MADRMADIELAFESAVTASPAEAWRWIASIKGISRELWPYLRMTAPSEIETIGSVNVTLGQPLFRSRLLLSSVVPMGHSDLTLLEFEEGVGFVEQSTMS